MKMKLFVLTIVLVTLLTGCKFKFEADSNTDFSSYYEFAVTCEGLIGDCKIPEDIETMKVELINKLEEYWLKLGISETDKDEIVKFFNERSGYFPEFDIKDNAKYLQQDYVNLLCIYEGLPWDCYGMTFEELAKFTG